MMLDFYRLRRGSAARLLPANGQRPAAFSIWERKGYTPLFFPKSAQVGLLADGHESTVFRSAQVVSIVGVAQMRKSSKNARDWSLYYLTDIIPKL